MQIISVELVRFHRFKFIEGKYAGFKIPGITNRMYEILYNICSNKELDSKYDDVMVINQNHRYNKVNTI